MEQETRNSCKRIYLADDDIDDRKIFAEILETSDQSVVLVQAEDGEQLLNQLVPAKDPLPDLIVVDINMPKKSGFDCLREIREAPGSLKTLKVIVLSTCNDPVSIEQAFKLGAACYAVKPNTISGWRLLINDLLTTDWSSYKSTRKNFARTYDVPGRLQPTNQNPADPQLKLPIL